MTSSHVASSRSRPQSVSTTPLTRKGTLMSICPSRKAVAPAAAIAVAAVALATSTWVAPRASADDVSWQMWTLANNQHTADGCQPYTQAGALNDEAGARAKTMITFPKGTIAGNGLNPTDLDLSNRGYFVRTWGEADYQNNAGQGSPQNAMNFWMSQPTSQIFKDCDNTDLATAYFVQGKQWAGVLIAASPGGTPPAPFVPPK